MSQMIKLPQQEMSVEALKALIAEAEAPRFKVGQRAVYIHDAGPTGWGVVEIVETGVDGQRNYRAKSLTTPRFGLGCFSASMLRLATLEEIAAATRIVPKIGMLVDQKRSGNVYRCYQIGHGHSYWHGVNCGSSHPLKDLSTEDYEVLPRYTIEGAEP